MLKVERIECQLYASNVYILEDDLSDKVWLVDIGTANLPIPDGKTVAGVFITHTHIDHIQGINALIEKYPDCVIYTSAEGSTGLYDDKVNLTFYHDQPLCFKGGKIHIVKDGDSIPLFADVDVKIFETPGHHPSCLTFVAGDYILTGDAYIPDVKVVTNLPGGDKEMATKSIERIIALASGKMICPGHGTTNKL